MTRLTPRDKEILSILCHQVRVLNRIQIRDTWWPDTVATSDAAIRRINKLAEVELVSIQHVFASELPPMDHPVASWKPKTPAPDFGAVAWKLQSRWTAGVVKTPVYTATSKSSKMFGGRGGKRLKLSFHATHDLGVSQMFLNLRRNDADKAATWIGEDDLAPFRYRQKLPDAVLAKAPDQRPRLVLEFGGSYDKQRVEAFHRDCQKRHLPYEIW